MLTIDIPREPFVDAVGWVARSLPTRPVAPVLAGLLIESDYQKNLVQLSAYDYESSAQITLDMSLVGGTSSSGSALVSGRLLAAIGRSLPKGGSVVVEAEGPTATLRCGKAEFTLPTMTVAEYPKLPIMPDDAGTVDAASLSTALSAVLPAVSRDDAQAKLVSVCVEVTSAYELTLFCTDKHRVAIRTVPWKGSGSAHCGAQLLLPAKAAAELARQTAGTVSLAFDEKSTGAFGVHAGNRRTTTRLLAEQYPDCRKIVPKDFATTIEFDVAEWSEALGRALLLDEQEYPRVHVYVGDAGTGCALVEGGQQGIGGFREEVPADIGGGHTDFWLNPRFLLDALRTLGSERGVLRACKELRPIVVQPAGLAQTDLSSLHMVMPVTGP